MAERIEGERGGPGGSEQPGNGGDGQGRGRRLRGTLVGGAVALAAGGAAALLGGCGSLSKEAMRERLLDLPVNRPVAQVGLSSLSIEVDLADGPRTFELTYLRVPTDPEYTGPERAPVVLVHGTPDTLFAWTPLIFGEDEGAEAALAGPRDVYAIEVVGHGVAAGELDTTTFEDCARFVNAAVRALDLPPVHVVGNSYGGEFVWRAALNDPTAFASLTVIDSSGYARRPSEFLPEEREMRENGLADIGYLINSRERIETALAPHYDTIPEGRIEEVFLVCENVVNWRAMIDLVQDEEGHRQDEIADIRVPTLVVWGEDDIAYDVERYGRAFARDIPFARFVSFADTGHYPHETRREEFLAALENFYRDVEDL